MPPVLPTSWKNAVRLSAEEGNNDRHCLYLSLTPQGEMFLSQLLKLQYECLHFLWSTLNEHEQKQLEQLTDT